MSWILEELGIAQDASAPRQSEVALDAALAHVHSEGMRVKPKKMQTRIAEKVLQPISQGTHTKRGRQQIMKHLEECFQKPLENDNWRKIHSSLVIASQAMLNGSPTLLEEIAEGRHFNPLQQVSLLSHYKMEGISIDSEKLVRSKASALHDELQPQLQAAIEADKIAKLVTKVPLTTTTPPYQSKGLLTALFWEVGLMQDTDQPTQTEVELAEALAFIPSIDVQPKRMRTLVPQVHLQKISKGTHTDKGRQMIMQHLRSFLMADVSDWRPVYAAIVIASEALLKGSPILLQDISEGRHFDPLQRLVLLETYESGDDDGNARAATNLIRQKAHELRDALAQKLQPSTPAPAVLLDNPLC